MQLQPEACASDLGDSGHALLVGLGSSYKVAVHSLLFEQMAFYSAVYATSGISVCPYIHHTGIVSKRANAERSGLHHRVASPICLVL